MFVSSLRFATLLNSRFLSCWGVRDVTTSFFLSNDKSVLGLGQGSFAVTANCDSSCWRALSSKSSLISTTLHCAWVVLELLRCAPCIASHALVCRTYSSTFEWLARQMHVALQLTSNIIKLICSRMKIGRVANIRFR